MISVTLKTKLPRISIDDSTWLKPDQDLSMFLYCVIELLINFMFYFVRQYGTGLRTALMNLLSYKDSHHLNFQVDITCLLTGWVGWIENIWLLRSRVKQGPCKVFVSQNSKFVLPFVHKIGSFLQASFQRICP